MTTDPLAQLHDIHLPTEPDWWPLAPGWWLLLTMLVVVVGLLALRLWQRHRRDAWRRAALAELDCLADAEEPGVMARDLNRLLRRVARQIEGAQAAALSGDEWVEFLRSHAPASLPAGIWDSLAQAPYRPTPTADTEAWLHGCRRWISHV